MGPRQGLISFDDQLQLTEWNEVTVIMRVRIESKELLEAFHHVKYTGARRAFEIEPKIIEDSGTNDEQASPVDPIVD